MTVKTKAAAAPGTLCLKLNGWYYAPHGSSGHNEAFSKFCTENLYGFWGPGNKPAWVVRPDDATSAVARRENGKAFTSLQVTFSWVRSANNLALNESDQLRSDIVMFDDLFKDVSKMLRSRWLKQDMAMDKSRLLCWELWDPSRPGVSKLSRWILSAPEKPISLPGERIEEILYNLVKVKIVFPETVHIPCGQRAVLGCIKSQLTAQNVAFNSLCHSIEELLRMDRQGSQRDQVQMGSLIAKNVLAIEDLGAALATLVALFEDNVGKAPRIKGNWALVARVKAFIRGPFGAVAIDDSEVEMLKKNARAELSALQRTAPILAAHIRLHDCERRSELHQAYHTAAAGQERTIMLDKLNISVPELNRAESRASQLAVVRKQYQNTYMELVTNLKALDKLLDIIYDTRGEALFNVRGRFGRFGRKIRGGRSTCVTEEEREQEKDDTWDARVSMESEVTWYEKAEPRWLV